MSTFLELGQKMHREVGMAGTLSSMTSQTGMFARLVGYIQDADLRVKKKWIDWNFLWAEWTLTLVAGIDEYSPPDLLGTFKKDSFWIDSGSDDAATVEYVDYQNFAGYRHMSIDADEPYVITVTPSRQVKVSPEPDSASSGKIISCEYWKRPVKMTDNSAVSVIPVEFHDIIVWRAKMFYYAFRHNNGARDEAEVEYLRMLQELEAHSLPHRSVDQMSTSETEPLVITVE